MKIIQENAGKTTQEVAVPDMQQNCLYQVEVGYHDFKCLQTEGEYQAYQNSQSSFGDIVLGCVLILFVGIFGFIFGRINS